MSTTDTRYYHAQPGDTVVRDFCGVLMTLRVTEVRIDRLVAGAWEFDRRTGFEIDDFMHWGPKYGRSGSRLVKWISRLDIPDETC